MFFLSFAQAFHFMYDDASDIFGSTLTFLADHEYSDQVGWGQFDDDRRIETNIKNPSFSSWSSREHSYFHPLPSIPSSTPPTAICATPSSGRPLPKSTPSVSHYFLGLPPLWRPSKLQTSPTLKTDHWWSRYKGSSSTSWTVSKRRRVFWTTTWSGDD